MDQTVFLDYRQVCVSAQPWDHGSFFHNVGYFSLIIVQREEVETRCPSLGTQSGKFEQLMLVSSA